jgi:hypothetical protein
MKKKTRRHDSVTKALLRIGVDSSIRNEEGHPLTLPAAIHELTEAVALLAEVIQQSEESDE